MKKVVFTLLPVLVFFLGGCAQSALHDDIHDGVWEMGGGAWTGVDAPAGFVGSVWSAPHERAADDITLADLPYFAFGVVDPFNMAPPPFGTMYVPWKLFITAVRAFPFVTYPKEGENGSLVMWAGKNPGPIWYAIGPGLSDVDSFVVPVRESETADFVPVPGHGSFGEHWKLRARSHFAHFRHIGETFKYYFLNTNADQPPYDSWFPEQMERDKTTIHQTFDHFLFLYDWDDPYLN